MKIQIWLLVGVAIISVLLVVLALSTKVVPPLAREQRSPVVESQKPPNEEPSNPSSAPSPGSQPTNYSKPAAAVPLTPEQIQAIIKQAEIEGKKIPEPKLYKYTEYPPTTKEGKAMWAWWNKMHEVDANFEFRRPIAFYGVVEDENGNPMANVPVGFSIRGNGDTYIQSQSDNEGRFELENKTGRLLTVGAQIKDYLPNIQNFNYAEFFSNDFIVPDPNNPVVFQLKKRPPH